MPTSKLRGKAVLVVEDEILIAMEIEAILQDAGAEVIGPCSSVAEALEVLQTTEVAVASLDVRLGYETSEKIASTLSQKGIPFIFYSGQALPESIERFCPGHALLAKPANGEKLVSFLAAALDANETSPSVE